MPAATELHAHAGIVSAPRTDLNPVVTDQPAQHPPSQRGAFGGRAAVAKLFGLTDAGELPTIEETLSRASTAASELDSADVLSAAVDSLMHESMGSVAESAVTRSASLTIKIPAGTAQEHERQSRHSSLTEDVSVDVENLLSASLDNMLFGTDDSVLNGVSTSQSCLCKRLLELCSQYKSHAPQTTVIQHIMHVTVLWWCNRALDRWVHLQAFMLPAQQTAEASMDGMSQRTNSMDSMRTEDDSEARIGGCYESHLERHSPTSLLPEHPFSIPVLKVGVLTDC